MKLVALLLLCFSAPAATLRYWVEPCANLKAAAARAIPNWRSGLSKPGSPQPAGSSPAKAQIRVYWATADMCLYGEARPIILHGVRGAEVYVRPGIVPSGETESHLTA